MQTAIYQNLGGYDHIQDLVFKNISRRCNLSASPSSICKLCGESDVSWTQCLHFYEPVPSKEEELSLEHYCCKNRASQSFLSADTHFPVNFLAHALSKPGTGQMPNLLSLQCQDCTKDGRESMLVLLMTNVFLQLSNSFTEYRDGQHSFA